MIPSRRGKGGALRTIVVDGYNVINAVPDLRALVSKSMETARKALLERCLDWLRSRGDVGRIVVVFDGQSIPEAACRRSSSSSRLTEIYTEKGETADERIVALVLGSGCRSCLVVTADREVRGKAGNLGAEVISPLSFVETCTRSDRRRSIRGTDDDGRNLSVQERSAISRELLRLWDA